jgi:alginate O-acetyltransferase complex protein AlgI
MYGAMFSFGDWGLSELNAANLTGLQIATMVVAYITLAFFGLRDLYSKPLQNKAPKAEAASDAEANGPATAQPGLLRATPGDQPAQVAAYAHGHQVQASAWVADWPRYAMRTVILLLFVASILKLSAQSFSPFLYFQF